MRTILYLTASTLAAFACHAQVAVTMNRYNTSALGANPEEPKLTVKNVNPTSFGKLYSYYVDGSVYAQPLYVPGVSVPGRGVYDVLYVATMNDKVYAFDAKRNGPPLWIRDFTDEFSGVTPVPITDITNDNGLNLVGNVGIEGTPVIDLPSRAIYLVVRTREQGQYFQRLHRLDLSTGADQSPPTVIEASAPGAAKDAVGGFVHFNPKSGNQRPALAISGGNVIVAWASHEDIRPYHGWIMAFDTKTLKQTGALCITPDGADGGIWQSGRAPVLDEAGNIYFEVGNGSWDGKRNFGDAVIKVAVDAQGLHVVDFYTPADYMRQNERDADLGSSGPIRIPATNALLCGNKQGELFVLNKDALGGMTPGNKGIRQVLDLKGGRLLAGPAFWNGPGGYTLFVWNESSVIQSLRVEAATKRLTPIAKGAVLSHGSPGGALTVSSNGASADTGIVWATVGKNRSADHGNAPGVLYAFRASTLETLWNSETNPKRDRLGTLVKFVPPLVVDGRVYVPNYDNAVNVYGLLGSPESPGSGRPE